MCMYTVLHRWGGMDRCRHEGGLDRMRLCSSYSWILYMLKFSPWINVHVFREIVYSRENKKRKIIGNWSENEARYIFAKNSRSQLFFTISRNKIPAGIWNVYGTCWSREEFQIAWDELSLLQFSHKETDTVEPLKYGHPWANKMCPDYGGVLISGGE